jgi:Cu/Ag efflux pump CusA
VADVSTFGGLVKQFQIEINPLALEKYNVSISQIARAVGANNRNAGGALLDNRQQSLVVRGVGLLRSTSDIENVVIKAVRGVEGIVLMRRGENPSEVLAGVRDTVDELNSTRLAPHTRIVPIYDRTELVGSTLSTVSHTLAEGLVIVFLVLLFFLGSFRAALAGSLVFTLTLVPVLASWWLGSSSREWRNPVVAWVTRRYTATMQWSLRAPWIGTSVALLLAGSLGTEFLPQLDEGVIWIRANLPPGISLFKSAEVATGIRSVIRDFPEVRGVASQTGRVDSGTDPFGPNRNEFLVTLTPYSSWPTGSSADTAIEQEADQPQLRIDLDRTALARYALNVEDVQDLIELAIGGRAPHHSGVHPRGRQGASLAARRHPRRQRRQHHRPSRKPPPPPRRQAPLRLPGHLGRPVREPRPRPPPSGRDSARHRGHHFCPALLDLRLRRRRPAGARQRAPLHRGRRAGPLSPRH